MWREFSVGPFIFTKENLEYGKLLERELLKKRTLVDHLIRKYCVALPFDVTVYLLNCICMHFSKDTVVAVPTDRPHSCHIYNPTYISLTVERL